LLPSLPKVHVVEEGVGGEQETLRADCLLQIETIGFCCFGGEIGVSQYRFIAGRSWIGRRAMMAERPGYLAYLLRLWRVNDDGKPVWRASLESPHTGERHGFANLERLFAFLEEKTEDCTGGEEPPHQSAR
jgi:hypothetical protein